VNENPSRDRRSAAAVGREAAEELRAAAHGALGGDDFALMLTSLSSREDAAIVAGKIMR
jgi:hypothetical protein